MTDQRRKHKVESMSSERPEHERLFDEISNKLSELSKHRADSREDSMGHQEKMDRLQSQIRHFQSELQTTQAELRDKIKSLEGVHVVQQTDLNQHLKQVNDQLASERATTSKLSADLAKSLETGLQLQLELQNARARIQQVQHELELARALKDETETELEKARAEISMLSAELETLSGGMEDLQSASSRQQDALKNLSDVAESKIIELKLALDRKGVECGAYESHLQQTLTQNQLLKQENLNLKDYIAKINVYLQSNQSVSVVAPSITPIAPAATPIAPLQ